MMGCPEHATLQAFLNEQLPADERQTVAGHIQTCLACHVWLEQYISGESLRGGLISLATDEFQGSLRALGQPRSPLEILKPASMPGILGFLDDYEVTDLLGEGGMGVVFQARDPRLDRVVALKVLRYERTDGASRERFVREGQALARIRNDHVINVYGVSNPSDGPPFLVMELLEGPTLATRIAEAGHLPPREAADIAAQVARGLSAAHAAGLVHRDIKPSNIMQDRTSGRWKLMDFGLVQNALVSTTLTQSGTLAGTPAYMSPEQVRGTDRLDARSDVYSLGLTLYESLTGEVPFRGALHLVLQQILHEVPRPPGRIQEGIPRDLDVVCQKAMSREAGRRYPSAESLADDLERWLRGEPIRARPGPWWQGISRWVASHRAISALACTLLLVILGANWALWSLWLTAEETAVRERRQFEETERQRQAALRQEREAQASFEDALSALRHLSQVVVDDEVLKQTQLVELRHRLARGWTEQYQRMLERRPGDPRILSALADGQLMIAATMNQAASRQETVAAWADAVRILQELTRLEGESGAAAERLIKALLQLGQLQSELLQFDAATSSLQESLRLCEKFVQQDANNPQRIGQRVSIHGAVARLASLRGDHASAAAALVAIRDAFARLSNQDPARILYRQNLGVAEQNLAIALSGSGSPREEVEAAYRRSLAVRQQLVHDSPSFSSWDVNNLANTCSGLGQFLAGSGNFGQALEFLTQACDLRERVLAETPGGTRVSFLLAGDCLECANILESQQLPNEAARWILRARERIGIVLELEPEFILSGEHANLLRILDFSIRRGDGAAAQPFAQALVEVIARKLSAAPEDPAWLRLQTDAWSRRAAVESLLGHWEQAQVDLERALTSFPKSRPEVDGAASAVGMLQALRVRLVQALVRQGREDAARRIAAACSELAPNRILEEQDPAVEQALADEEVRQFLEMRDEAE